jgi:hypothetical protein
MKSIALAICGYAVVLAFPSPVNAEVGLGTACRIKCAEMKVTCERIKTARIEIDVREVLEGACAGAE